MPILTRNANLRLTTRIHGREEDLGQNLLLDVLAGVLPHVTPQLLELVKSFNRLCEGHAWLTCGREHPSLVDADGLRRDWVVLAGQLPEQLEAVATPNPANDISALVIRRILDAREHLLATVVYVPTAAEVEIRECRPFVPIRADL